MQINAKLLWCLALVYVIWGSTYLAMQIATGSFPPFLLAASRYSLAGLMLFVFLKMRGAPWPTWRQWRNAIAMGFLLLSIGNGLVCLALGQVSSSVAAVIYACGPIFALVFDRLQGGRSLPVEWIGVAMGIAGVLLIHADDAMQANWIGSAIVLIASASTSLAIVLQPGLDMPKGGLSAPAQMIGGAVCLVPMAVLHGEHLPQAVTTTAWLAFAYLVVLGSMVTYSAYIYVMNHASPGLATSNEYVNAVVAMILGYFIAHDVISGTMLGGAAVILLGVVLVAWGHSRREGRQRRE